MRRMLCLLRESNKYKLYDPRHLFDQGASEGVKESGGSTLPHTSILFFVLSDLLKLSKRFGLRLDCLRSEHHMFKAIVAMNK